MQALESRLLKMKTIGNGTVLGLHVRRNVGTPAVINYTAFCFILLVTLCVDSSHMMFVMLLVTEFV